MVTTFATIMEKLKDVSGYPMFIRHVNGNTLDNRVENLRWVELKDALRNVATWKVDWVCYVTDEEVSFLKKMLTPK